MRKSFTLLEMLIVVAILAILATFAIPQYLTAIERTKMSKARANLKLILDAEVMYRAENNSYLAVNEGESFDATFLGDYVELVDIDNDEYWTYRTVVIGNIVYILATRTSGRYVNKILYISSNGNCYTTHPLGGC